MTMTTTTNLHALLLLSDSALPLGSFAFSSGLESFLAHTKAANTNTSKSTPTSTTPTSQTTSPTTPSPSNINVFHTFLNHSLSNLASTALPYVLAAHADPSRLQTLDNDFDASTPCTVARRASIAQGRALLAVWERSLAPSYASPSSSASADGDEGAANPAAGPAADSASPSAAAPADSLPASAPAALTPQALAVQALTLFSHTLKIKTKPTPSSPSPSSFPTVLQAHLPPLLGTISLALSLTPHETSYIFLLNHAKSLLSAGVRASVMGPYQAQAVLASAELQRWIAECIEREKDRRVEEASVSVPVMDLWMGRHEVLYSRIFNS